jgi:hypothetical protein
MAHELSELRAMAKNVSTLGPNILHRLLSEAADALDAQAARIAEAQVDRQRIIDEAAEALNVLQAERDAALARVAELEAVLMAMANEAYGDPEAALARFLPARSALEGK